MEAIEKSCCVVTVKKTSDHHHDGRSISCSGVILEAQSGMVICNALPFSRFIDDAHIKQSLASDQRFMLPHNVGNGKLDIRVRFHEQRHHVDGNPCTSTSACEAYTDVSKSDATRPQHDTSTGAELVMLVNCLEFRKAFLSLFKEADKWRIYGGVEEDEEDEELARDSQFLGWFAVLRAERVVDGASDSRPLPWTKSSSLQKGCPVVACGTPFGSLCQDLFMSTLSRGIVSNLAGEENAVILTDARCLPGTEGGGLFLPRGGGRGGGADLVGVIVSPLCWKANEWIGLTLVCSAQVIFRNIMCCMKTEGSLRDMSSVVLHRAATDRHPSSCSSPTDTDRYLSSGSSLTDTDCYLSSSSSPTDTYPTVCLVDSGHFWGSGVMVAPRLALTCRHVVAGKSSVTLRFHCRDRFHAVPGEVLFSTSSSSPYDLAVVRLPVSAPQAVIPQLATRFQPGEDVVVLGYGGLGQNCGPSLTSGILSRAISWSRQPVMLQTTCAVQAGASGGAVVRKHSGELLGIVSSNTRDYATEVTYPHLNFSVPVTVFQTLLQHFDRTGDVEAFRALDSPEDGVRKVWRLQAAQSKL